MEKSFIVNGQKIFAIYDVPHLLKSTRNCLLRHNIRFDGEKLAKMETIRQCYLLDQNKRYQALHKLKNVHFELEKRPQLKMKVAVAARTLSNTVAAAIETMCVGGQLPMEALDTAEFAATMDKLFDSLNGRTLFPEGGKLLRRCITAKTRHMQFWAEMQQQIQKWIFVDKWQQTSKAEIPFKSGWIITLRGVQNIWKRCHSVGFKFLATRNLNQDGLENLFGVIRQHGAANTNPTCHNFIAALKTAVLNRLITPHSGALNCEPDGGSILDNMKELLTEDISVNFLSDSEHDINELLDWSVSEINDLSESDFDTQTISYICGYLIKKINLPPDCTQCAKIMCSTVQTHHIYTFFKEISEDKTRLHYVSKEFVNYVACLHDTINNILKLHAHINHIRIKMFPVLNRIDFSNLECKMHCFVKKNIIQLVSLFCIFKFCKDKK